MATLPRRVIEMCRAVKALDLPCPLRAPRAGDADFQVVSFGTDDLWTFSAQVGAPGRSSLRPPAFVHVAIQAGDLATAFQAFTYSRSQIVDPRAGILTSRERIRFESLGSEGKTPQGLYFGTRTWAGETGDLVLVPEFEYVDTIHAGHLLFRWHRRTTGFVVSLHAREPFPQTVTALRKAVESIHSP